MTHRRLICALTAVCLIAIGILWRTAPLHLPRFAYKYGGSFLWGAMIYFVIAALLPRLSPAKAAILTAAIAALVECSRLLHTPSLDAFRATLPGRLLLGQYFALHNIATYWAGIVLAALLDHAKFPPSPALTPKLPPSSHV